MIMKIFCKKRKINLYRKKADFLVFGWLNTWYDHTAWRFMRGFKNHIKMPSTLRLKTRKAVIFLREN